MTRPVHDRPARLTGGFDRPNVAVAKATRMPFLHRVHPLAKLAIALVTTIVLLSVHGKLVPAVIAALATLALLLGTRLPWTQRALALVGLPGLAAVLAVTLGIWVDPELTVGTPTILSIGEWEFRRGAIDSALETSLRLVAILAVAIMSGASTAGEDVVRALVQQLRVPYRFGYAALAAMRFVPRFRREIEIIRQAQRARGIGFGPGPVGWVRRQLATLVPLLAAAMRHADRVALSMDSRAFGYRPMRTERTPLPFGTTDAVVVVVGLAFVAAVVAVGAVLDW